MATEVVVGTDGNARMIYDESLDTRAIGIPTIVRGSHVEPTSDGRWTADLSPVRGPLLGPFDHRSEALSAEVSWLRQYWLMPPRG